MLPVFDVHLAIITDGAALWRKIQTPWPYG